MARAERKLIKEVANAKLYSDGSIKVENIRFSFPHIGEPQENESDDGRITKKFGGVGMLPKKTHLEAKNLIKSVILELIKENDAKVPTDKWFLANGDDKEQEEYADHFIISASDPKRPTARKRNGEVMSPEEADEAFYGGMWGHMFIRPWYFNGKAKNSKKTFPKRICCGLIAVQFVRDDEAFGQGRINDDGIFDEEEGGDDWNDRGDDDI